MHSGGRGIFSGFLTAALLAAAARGGELPVKLTVHESAGVAREVAPDPEVIRIIEGLGENSSAFLPTVKTAGEMNDEVKRFKLDKTGPRPRDYCLKWVWAPDRKRALFCGGNAGTPHRMNDVWEYDLASNTWILLWNPDPDLNKARHMDAEEKKKLVDSIADVRDGVLMTKRGAPFDPVHTWWALTYDPEMKAMLWVMGHQNKVGYKFETTLPYKHMRLWAYYPAETRWEFIRTDTYPTNANASILEYIPDLKGPVWYTRNAASMQVYEPGDNKWTELLPKGNIQGSADCPDAEAIGAYDTKNKIMVVHRGGGTHKGKPVPTRAYHYDVEANEWKKVLETGEDEGPLGYDNRASMVYDSAAGVCLLVEAEALWSYRVEDKKWKKVTPQGPGLGGTGDRPRAWMACYNPEYNVLMADNGKGKVWVYRAAKAK